MKAKSKKNTMISLSVITPVFNGGRFLEELILNVQNQNYTGNIEHIVINDGSTDFGVTQKIISKYPHLVTSKPRGNLGQYATINEAIKLASGDFLVIISVDDLFFDDKVFSKICAALASDEKINLIYGKSLRMSEKGHPIVCDEIVIKEPFAKWRFKYQLPLLHCSAFIKRRFLLDNNLYFDDLNFKYAADWDWFLRISKLTDFFFIDLLVSKYRLHLSQITNTVERRILHMEDILVLKKNKSSIHIYYVIKNFERIRKAIVILKKQGVIPLWYKFLKCIK